jgi:hypothetical protein
MFRLALEKGQRVGATYGWQGPRWNARDAQSS